MVSIAIKLGASFVGRSFSGDKEQLIPLIKGALDYLERHGAQGELVTGLLFIDRAPKDLHQHLGTVAAPLNSPDEAQLCPGSATLAAINASLR